MVPSKSYGQVVVSFIIMVLSELNKKILAELKTVFLNAKRL